MNEELLVLLNELSKRPTTELAMSYMEMATDNIEKDKEIERLTAESTEWESKYYQLQDIIKEVREYIKNLREDDEYLEELHFNYEDKYKLLEILDKENK